jgi:hypothetical protein
VRDVILVSPEGVRQSGRLFPRAGFVPVDHGFSQGDHRRPEIPHPLVLRFHGFLVVRHRRGFVVANGGTDGEEATKVIRLNMRGVSPENFRVV